MIHIKPFTKEYISQVVSLSHKIFNIYERFETSENAKLYEESGFIALNENKDVIGYSMFGIIHYKEHDEFTILSLGVDENHRKLGVAKKLISEIRNYFRKCYDIIKENFKIKREIHLQVRRNNIPARKLYHKQHFQEVKLIENYYREPVEDAIHMVYKF